MRSTPHLRSLALLGVFAACAAPGVEIRPEPGDFAFLEVALRG